jgi:hypothetical protein
MPARTPTRTGWAAPRGPFPQPPAPPRPDGVAAVYRRRDPTATPLYPLVQHHLETFLADAAAADPDGEGLPQWVEDDFRAYLRCGILAHGFARIRCDACAAERLVAFSCKGRGVCPSCNARRMVEVAAHLTDHVLPPLPLRQWVLSLPKRIRPFLSHDPRLAGDVLRVLLRGTRTTLRRSSPSATGDAQLGAVSFLHRFGSALNPHFHFHVVILDGVFSEGDDGSVDDGSVTFHEATHLTADDVLRLERTLQRRVLRLFQRRGLLTEDTVEDMLTWQASGGFSLDASVRIHGSDSAGRERLIRYGARPPFALERLRIERYAEEAEQRTATAPHGEAGVNQVLYLPARPTPDGRTVLALSPLEFLAALSRLIPPPRVHRHRYHGVLAPNARLRERVIRLGRDDAAAPGGTDSRSDGEPRDAATAEDTDAADLPDSPHRAAARSRWARLLARIYEVFPLACPDCGGDMRILAFITAAEPVDAILTHLGLPTTAPPRSPARGPPQHDLAFDADPGFDLDQTPAYDLSEPEPVPDFDFNQDTGA